MNVLVLAAHPDDETLGAGATIAKLADQGHSVKLLTFTDGEGARGPTEKNRNNKSRNGRGRRRDENNEKDVSVEVSGEDISSIEAAE